MKSAYPNFAPDSVYTKPAYNLNKWLDAMRIIYTNVHFGRTYKEAFAGVTGEWGTVEKRDFETWLEYYQANNQNKYKKANFYVNDNIPGYFLPNPKTVPSPVVSDLSEPVDVVQKEVAQTLNNEEKRFKIEEQRKRIIGRLNAAVKHLTSHDGHMLVGEDFEKLLSSMYELIKQFQTVNKISLSNQLYYDVIIRQANKLSHLGYKGPASFLRKFAQNNTGKLDASGPIPIASQNSSVAGGTLNSPLPIDAIAPDNSAAKSVFDELFENLETAGLTTDDNLSLDSDEEVSLDDDLEVEAQLAPSQIGQSEVPKLVPPPIQNITTSPPKPLPSPEEELEVKLPAHEPISMEQEIKDESNSKIDSIIDEALSHITIEDVINKIENVNAIFQNRNIARELSIIDLMLSNLGLSSYFSNLSEIIQKNHESSNYSISRLSDILSKLRGAVNSSTLILTDNVEISPAVKEIQQKLEDQKNKEDKRKEMRKQLSNEEIDETLSPKTPSLSRPSTPGAEIADIPTQLVQ